MLRLAYFADDFTGATDAMESLARSGLQVRLFLEVPTLAQCAGLDAIGVAGLTRSLAPDAMESVLRPAFTALKALAPRHVHYKVCSTFDSSPMVGSIGRAIDVGAGVFGQRPVPLLVAAPALGRYCAFGQLFARFGIGSAGAIHRLDRHPAISRHPMTPMNEADLRVHLAKQTAKRIGLLDLTALEAEPAHTAATFDALAKAGHEIVLIDGLNNTHLLRAGALIDGLASNGTVFSVGSSGIETALTAHWAKPARTHWSAVTATGPLLVISGSCSPVTAGQIGRALDHGFTGLHFDPQVTDQTSIQDSAITALQNGQPVIIYTSRGEAKGTTTAESLGNRLGQLALAVVLRAKLNRVVFAGGDTSSFAARALGITSMEIITPFVPGAPWCRAAAPGSAADGLQLNFKGGQVGAPDYFEIAAQQPL